MPPIPIPEPGATPEFSAPPESAESPPAPAVDGTAPAASAPAFVQEQPEVPVPAIVRLKDRVPNASAGKPYRACLPEVWGEDSRHVIVEKVILPAETGLEYDAADVSLKGTPATAGEYQLRVRLALVGDHSGKSTERIFHLTINPDPRSLWKNLPSDPDLLFSKPDDEWSAVTSPELHWLGASRRGRSHAHDAKPRDDHYGFRRLDNGWHVAVVSDGAGSAKYSRRGSQLACEITLELLGTRLEEGLESPISAWLAGESDECRSRLHHELYTLLAGTAFEVHKALLAEATRHGAQSRDFNATYLVVIARQFRGEWFTASFSIGDGGAGLLEESGELHLLSSPDGGEFAGQTLFINMSSVFTDSSALMRRIQFCRTDSLRMMILMTDGVTDPKFETEANFKNAGTWHLLQGEILKAVEGAMDAETAAAGLLLWLNFWSPGNHDDRTIVVGLPPAGLSPTSPDKQLP
jgi:serine/threonine protein phosphatase PrpC